MLTKIKSLLVVGATLGLLAGSAGAASAVDSWSHVKPAHKAPLVDSWSHVKPTGSVWGGKAPSVDSWSGVKPLVDSWS